MSGTKSNKSPQFTWVKNVAKRTCHASSQTLYNCQCCLSNETKEIKNILQDICKTFNTKESLEQELSQMKFHTCEAQRKFNEIKQNLENEVIKLKEDLTDKNSELMNLKNTYLQQQKELLNQINDLRSQIEIIRQKKLCDEVINLKKQKTLQENLFQKEQELKVEKEKNIILQLKVAKYRSKLKIFKFPFVSLKKSKLKIKNEDETDVKKINTENTNQANVENMILSELFFSNRTSVNDIG